MNIFIFGGECQKYLKRQVELIREYITDAETIIFVTGPCTPSPISSASRNHVLPSVEGVAMLRIEAADVTPGIKQTRYRRLIEHLADKYLDGDRYGLMIHGDLMVVGTTSQELLLQGKPAAWSGGFAPKWVLTNGAFGGKTVHLEVGAKLWDLHITQIGGHTMQFFEPGFLHLDDISTDSEETMQSKLKALDEFISSPVS